MRLRAILFALVVFTLAGAGAWRVGHFATLWFERRTGDEIAAALAGAGENWASVSTDGLRVTLAGEAPDENSRFRAVEIARRTANDSRIDDVTTLRAATPIAPPAYAIEFLRNEAELSLIGLVPEIGGRDVIRAALGAGGLEGQVTDLLESASDPAPAGWQPALGLGLSLMAQLPRAKISVSPGAVAVSAVSDSDRDKAALEARLTRLAPPGVALTLDISAPRPVIAPFAFDFALTDGVARLATCTADSAETAEAILAAARGLGLQGGDCAIGLGAPTPDWPRAVTRGLETLRTLGGGRYRVTDIAAELTPPADATPEALVAASSALEQALPRGFSLQTVIPANEPAGTASAAPPAPRFEATLAEGGAVRLAGQVGDPASRAAILGYARALFGHERVTDAMDLDAALPESWPVRLLAGVEALAALKQGTLAVTPEQVALSGWSIDPDAGDRLEALLEKKVGKAADVTVAFNAAAAKAAAIAARPRPEICAEQIDAILAAGSIQFAAGSADIVPESQGVIAAIADVLRSCPGANFEIGGHTDSQGPAAANLRLSTARAEAVVAALGDEDLPLITFTARGYGADVPVADNATDAGRAMNRRIAFTLVDPDAPPASVAQGGSAEAAAEADAAVSCAAAAARILDAGQIEFEAGSATIAPVSAAVVTALAEALGACPDGRFEIAGHTDAQGSPTGNARLSGQRAQAVVDALAAVRPGLPALVARGYGEAQPVADNATEVGRARNRRIEVAALDPDPEAEPVEAALPALEGGDGPDAKCAADIASILAEDAIAFEAGSARLTADSRPVVADIAEALKACPDAAIEVGGHTDASGSAEGNLRLSQQRAEVVLAALRATGLSLPAFTARGYGETRPVAEGDSAEARAANRRIDFIPVTAEQQQDAEPDGPQ